jgi:hypothetical protein
MRPERRGRAEPFQTSKFDEFPQGIDVASTRMREMMELVQGIQLPEILNSF